MIVVASGFPASQRRALVDWVFDHPHRYTRDDIAWSSWAFDIDEATCRESLATAPRLAAVMLDEKPVYVFAVDAENRLSTASEERLESYRLGFTKELLRFRRSVEGRDFLRGAIGFAEIGDLETGEVNANWARLLGFQPYATAEFRGTTFQLFYFQG